MAETIALCFLIYGLVSWLFPANEKIFIGQCKNRKCVWMTAEGGMGRDMDESLKCPDCRAKFMKMIGYPDAT